MEMLLSAIRDTVAQMCQQGDDGAMSAPSSSATEVLSEARSFLGDYMNTSAWLDVEHCLDSAISSIQRCDVKVGELDLLEMLSTAKVSVGLVQAHLMWPTPIDPIVTARTKHQCLKNLVSK